MSIGSGTRNTSPEATRTLPLSGHRQNAFADALGEGVKHRRTWP